MTIFLKRFFLLFFSIVACLFMVYLMIPEAAHAHTGGHVAAQQLADTPTATTVPTTVATATTIPTATAAPSPMPTATTPPAPPPTYAPTTAPTPSPTATATPTPTATPTVGPTPTPPSGSNTNTNGNHATLNVVIFTMGGLGTLLVVIGVVLYFISSRPG
ncbi:MAG: hypothetical protein JO215_07595 [Ktedonobacteraceae bacterium]|nr:hypothetical protein [Ktedonobacteraceae bacterium]